jgi:hypothetical protein
MMTSALTLQLNTPTACIVLMIKIIANKKEVCIKE